MSQNFL